MPAAVPLLAIIGGGSAATGAAIAAGGAGIGASLYGAKKDRDVAKDNQQMSAQERAQALQFIQQQTGQAQDYLSNSMAPMQQALRSGYGGGLQALAGSFAPRMQAINQSSQDAQRFTLGCAALHPAGVDGRSDGPVQADALCAKVTDAVRPQCNDQLC